MTDAAMIDIATIETFADGDRVTHAIRGMGTVMTDLVREDLVLSANEAAKTAPGLVYVAWDDDRFAVTRTAPAELEKLAANVAGLSSGY